MVSTRVSKRKANERPKRQRRASTKFGEESVEDKPSPPTTTKKSEKEDAKKKKKQVGASPPKNMSETKQQPKKTMKRKGQQTSQAVASAAKKSTGSKVKNTTAKKKKIIEPTTTKESIDNDDESIMTLSVAATEEEKAEVRVRVRLDEKLNKGYRFARLNTTKISSTSKKHVADKKKKAQTKPSVAKKRGTSKVKQTVATANDDGGTRDKSIRVKVRVDMDVNVRVRMDNKLMKGGRSALVNDSVMANNDDDGEDQPSPQELVATAAAGTSQKKKSPKITIRVSKKKKEEEVGVGAKTTENGNAVTTSLKAKNGTKKRKQDNVDATNKEEGSITDTTEQQQQKPPPKKKVKITTQFGNDVDPKRLCIIDGCDKYKKARCGGHCLHHYEGLSDEAKADIAKENELKKLKMAPEKKRCRVEGCGKYFKARHDGFCLTCYREHRQDGKKGSSDNDDGNEQESMPDLLQGGDDDMKKASITSTGTAAAVETNTSLKSTKYCIFEGCMKYKQKGCIGYCLTHKEYADPEQRRIQNELAAAHSAVKKTANKSSLCKIVGCDKYKQANCGGYCLKHVKAKQAYDDDDLEDVTKVRVRCDNRLQNGFCVAILSDENRDKLGLERRPAMSDEDEDGVGVDNEDDIDDDDVEMEQGRDTVVSQPDFEISTVIRRKENGALLCKAVGCPKIAQTKDDGFCRTHYNRYKISTGQIESWRCKCGEKIAVTSLRCGKCHRWRDGHHPAYASSPQKSPGVPSPQYGKSKQPKTRIPADAGVEISDVLLKNDKGRLLCKVIGCGKAEQANNDGFCRTHFNEFAILPEDAEEYSSEKWVCECGEEWSGRHKRCGNTSCQKWRGGKRESYSYSPSKRSGISDGNIIKDSTWTCDNCGEKVEGRKSRCGSCHRWRGGKRQGGWTLGSATNYDSDDGGIDRTKDWSCDYCNDGEIISASQTRCGKCNRWRGGKRIPAPWECSKCNIINPGGKRRCVGCLAWKSKTKHTTESTSSATTAKSLPSMKLPAKTSKKPQAQAVKAVQPIQQSNVTPPASNQAPPLPDFGTIDLTKLSYVNYDFNQSYYESSDYSYLNGSFTSSYFPKDTESSEEKKDEIDTH